MKYIILLLACLLGGNVWAQADKKTQLEQQKKDNLAKIKELNSIITRTSKKKKVNNRKTFIAKPEASCQGKGIFLTRNLEDFDP